MGTTEDVGDRKYKNGEVLNTLRQYTDEEKAYMKEFDYQLDNRKTFAETENIPSM